MSLLSSALKGKGVQTAFCSLCSVPAAPLRALSNSARREITDEEFQSNRTRGEARLRADALQKQQYRKGRLNELVGIARDVANQGPADGSIITQIQENAQNNRRQDLPPGKLLHPGDLRKERMWPEPSMRRSTALDAMGPNHKKALQTDYFLNIPTANGKGINPLNEYLNPALLSHFVTNMGKIMGRAHTQLTWKNQRRLGKAVRRARSMGLMPYFGDCSDPQVIEAKFRKWGMPKTGRSYDDRGSSRRG